MVSCANHRLCLVGRTSSFDQAVVFWLKCQMNQWSPRPLTHTQTHTDTQTHTHTHTWKALMSLVGLGSSLLVETPKATGAKSTALAGNAQSAAVMSCVSSFSVSSISTRTSKVHVLRFPEASTAVTAISWGEPAVDALREREQRGRIELKTNATKEESQL